VATASNNGDYSSSVFRFHLHNLPCRTQLSTDNSQAGGHFTPTS
jgi:hypothetical protein